jgi:hypothetical protein
MQLLESLTVNPNIEEDNPKDVVNSQGVEA